MEDSVKEMVEKQMQLPTHQKTPAWRWLLIMQHLADYTQPVSMFRMDKLLLEGARYFRSSRDPFYRRQHFEKHTPWLVEAFRIFDCTWPSGYRWLMEALIMTGEDNETIAEHMRLEYGEKTVECYKHLFFDIDDYFDDELCLFVNVMSRAETRLNQYNIYDYTWKLVAWRFGIEGLKQFISPRNTLSKDMKDWLGDKASSNLTKEAFHASNSMSRLYCEQTVSIFTLATKFWDINPNVRGQIESEATEQALDRLMGSVKITLQDPTLSKRKFHPFHSGSGISWNDDDLELMEFIHTDIPEEEPA